MNMETGDCSLMTFKELSCKEVICTCDGARLGYISDLEFSTVNAQILSFLLPDNRFFSFSRKPKYRIRTDWVERFGEDLILVCKYEVLQKSPKN